MGNHYFDKIPSTTSNRREISFRFFSNWHTFISDDGVFSKEGLDTGSRILLETTFKQELKGSVLDYGCGIGVIGLLIKTYFPQLVVEGFDINTRAVDLANENASRLNLDVEFTVNNQIEENKTYDLIFMNPPIRTGKQNIYRMFRDAFNHLNENGRLFIVIRKNHGAASAIKELSSYFSSVSTINREKGFHILECLKFD